MTIPIKRLINRQWIGCQFEELKAGDTFMTEDQRVYIAVKDAVEGKYGPEILADIKKIEVVMQGV